MSQDILNLVEKTALKAEPPKFAIGDTVDVHTRILEGEDERIQIFSGTVIARSGSGSREMFTVRRLGIDGTLARTLVCTNMVESMISIARTTTRNVEALAGRGRHAPTLARGGLQSTKVWRIGYLGFGAASNWTSEVEALRSGLRELGYVDGQNLKMEFRWAERVDQTFELATQLVRMNVDVIFAPASTQVEPARRATTTIPIVFAQHADPVGLGDVASLSRPGGNITGISMLLTELSVKELEILKETLPEAGRIGVLWNPTTPSHPTVVRAVESASDRHDRQR